MPPTPTAVMLDIETLGTSVRCVVIEIAAAEFNTQTGEILRRFHAGRLCIDDQTAKGRTLDQSTLLWWMSQSEAARERVFAPMQKHRKLIADALSDMNLWLGEVRPPLVWSKGPAFDMAILESIGRTYGQPLNVKFWQYADLRTIIGQAQELGGTRAQLNPDRGQNIAHSAMDDVDYQIGQLMIARRWILRL